MWVIYRKKNRSIVGLTANSGIDPDKETALREIVGGSVNAGDPGGYEAIQVTDREKAARYLTAFPERLVVAGTPEAPRLSIRDPEVFSLYVTLDAPDRHPFDGIPTIPADGVSSTIISIQKMDERAKPQRAGKDDDRLFFRLDHGSIRDIDDGETISNVRLDKGALKVRLVSDPVKRVATIHIVSDNPDLQGSILRVEFV